MNKSIKFKNNVYLDSTSSSHKQVPLNEVLDKINSDIDAINADSVIVGGYNLLYNSNMINENDAWRLNGSGSIASGLDENSKTYGAVTGRVFALNNLTATQTVSVKPDNDSIESSNKSYYSFTVLVKKGADSTGRLRLYNGKDNYFINLGAESMEYVRHSIETVLPTLSTLTVEIESVGGSIVFADAMLSMSKTKTNWSQASNEFMNESTIINDDEFITEKIEVEKKIDMQNLSLMAVDTEGFKGWAIVRGGDE